MRSLTYIVWAMSFDIFHTRSNAAILGTNRARSQFDLTGAASAQLSDMAWCPNIRMNPGTNKKMN